MRRFIAMVVAVTFLVTASVDPAHAKSSKGGGGTAALAAVLVFFVTVITLGMISSIKINDKREETNRLAITEAHETERRAQQHDTTLAAGVAFPADTEAETRGDANYRIVTVRGGRRYEAPRETEEAAKLEVPVVPREEWRIRINPETDGAILNNLRVYIPLAKGSDEERNALETLIAFISDGREPNLPDADIKALRSFQQKLKRYPQHIEHLEEFDEMITLAEKVRDRRIQKEG
jgi:hypothetical protein